MKHELTQLATAIMFLTRIPVGNLGSGEPSDLAASMKYFPLVGVLIGALVSTVFVVASVFWNPAIATVITLIASVLFTGAFHEDGLADVADSAGAWSAERKLEVMRDSRVGTYGSLALILMMLLKFSALSTIAGQSQSIWVMVATLIFGHVLARWSILPMIRLTPYARQDSNNRVFETGVTNERLFIGSAITLVVMTVSALVLGKAVFAALLMTCVAIVLSRRWYLRRIGGITGDCLGATNQVVEVLVYLCVAGMSGMSGMLD